MSFLFLLFFRLCPPITITPRNIRCRVQKSHTKWKGAKQTTVYLHTYSHSKIILEEGNETHNIKPGEILSVVGEDVSLKCDGDDCDASIWHTDFVPQNPHHLNDASGSVFKLTNSIFPDEYSCLFDFGESTRVFATLMDFKRVGYSVVLTYFDEKSKTMITKSYSKNDLFDLLISSPAVLQIHRAKYSNVLFRIIAGSSRKIEHEFEGRATSGNVTVINNIYPEPINSSILESIAFISDGDKMWPVITSIFSAITGMFWLLTIVCAIIVVWTHIKFQKESESDDMQIIV